MFEKRVRKTYQNKAVCLKKEQAGDSALIGNRQTKMAFVLNIDANASKPHQATKPHAPEAFSSQNKKGASSSTVVDVQYLDACM